MTETSRSGSSRASSPSGSRWLRWVLVLADALAMTLAWLIVARLHVRDDPDGIYVDRRFALTPLVVGVTLLSIAAHRLYRARTCNVRAVELATLLRACAVAGAATMLLASRFGLELKVTRAVAGWGLGFACIAVGRGAYRRTLARGRRAGRFTRPVAIVGTNEEAIELYESLCDQPELGYDVRGLIGPPQGNALAALPALAYLGQAAQSADLVREHGINGVLIAPSSLDYGELNEVVRDLLEAGVHVQMGGGLSGFARTRFRANPIGREAAFYLETVSLSGWQMAAKRVIDVVTATVALVLTAPVVAVAAIVVKRHDGGPAFFRQERIGRDGRPFTIYKLRTMVVDAEARLAEVMARNERSGPLFKMADDPRFTPIGRLLDATSINEIPQFWNVLRGDMSVVGPRPALEREVARFDDRLLVRHRVKPGITGLWQVESREQASFRAYVRRDIFYVENWSVGLDLAILFQTAEVILRRALRVLRRGERPAPTPAEVLEPR